MPGVADATAIWTAGVEAVRPGVLLPAAVAEYVDVLASAERILVVGGGKAGAGMAEHFEKSCPHPERIAGLVNVPEGVTADVARIRLHFARPAGSNHPTDAGVVGTREMLKLFADAGPNDVGVCLLSGGGSALLPAPAAGLTLDDKQRVTKLLHACGASIDEMNCVRKHLSAVKGGRLAAAFRGKVLLTFIISDVIGDPLDVIASGPTAADPTTFADALGVLTKYSLVEKCPPAVLRHLERADGETLKTVPTNVGNRVIGSNAVALAAAKRVAERLGYTVTDYGPAVGGDTTVLANRLAAAVRELPRDRPRCLLLGGETTVTLGTTPGKGGRNTEFVLALMLALGEAGMEGVTVLSGGTDGEDGPTDAAGAVVDRYFPNGGAALAAHDSYTFFDAHRALLKTGLTGTNVMDLRLILVCAE